jgi:hypothetical protein
MIEFRKSDFVVAGVVATPLYSTIQKSECEFLVQWMELFWEVI